MRKILGMSVIAFGALLTFGGTVQLLRNLASANDVLLWGGLTILGLFVLGRGVITIMSATGGDGTADPENAVSKTDSRFGQH